jgi:hypothetical protein
VLALIFGVFPLIPFEADLGHISTYVQCMVLATAGTRHPRRAVTLIASWVPARRAQRLDPVAVIRQD